MWSLCRCSLFVVLLACACVSAADIRSLPLISAGFGVFVTQDTAVVVAGVDIKPETLALGSKGVFTASITLAGGLDVADIDVGTVECAGAPAVRGTLADGSLIVKFNREDLEGVTPGDAVTLTVTGQFTNDRRFMGTDVIRVIAKPEPPGKKK